MSKTSNMPYEDIIHLPHHTSPTRLRMPLGDRAAQFSPFAALVGYEDALEETARLTDRRIELDENEKYMLDLKQQCLLACVSEKPELTVTFFQPDMRKDGGSYRTVTGRLQAILPDKKLLILQSKLSIPLRDVIRLESPVFSRMDI